MLARDSSDFHTDCNSRPAECVGGMSREEPQMEMRNVDLATDAVKPITRATLYMRHSNDANIRWQFDKDRGIRKAREERAPDIQLRRRV